MPPIHISGEIACPAKGALGMPPPHSPSTRKRFPFDPGPAAWQDMFEPIQGVLQTGDLTDTFLVP
jgi:hypothetical protein